MAKENGRKILIINNPLKRMAINNRAKMQRTNGKIRVWMKKNNYKDILFFPHGKFQKDYHFCGEGFDAIARHDDRIVLLQAKTNCRITKAKLKRYDALAAQFGAEFLWFNAVDRKKLQVNNLQVETFFNTSPQLIP